MLAFTELVPHSALCMSSGFSSGKPIPREDSRLSETTPAAGFPASAAGTTATATERGQNEDSTITPASAHSDQEIVVSPHVTKSLLNEDLWIHVLAFLPLLDVVKGTLEVSRSWNVMAKQNEIWKLFCDKRWPWMALAETQDVGEGGTGEARWTNPCATSGSCGRGAAFREPGTLYRLYNQRARARHRVSYPPPLRKFTDFDLAVDLRSRLTNQVIYSCRGTLDEDGLGVDLFTFSGWVMTTDVVAVDEELLFENLSAAMAFFGEQGPCELDFTVIDRVNGKVAELATVSRFGTSDGYTGRTSARATTRCSLGWNVEGQRTEEELWVFLAPDAVFVEGNLRLMRGLTVKVEKVVGYVGARERDGSGENAQTSQGRKGEESRDREKKTIELVRCRVIEVWMCDHQYLNAQNMVSLEVARIFDELHWV